MRGEILAAAFSEDVCTTIDGAAQVIEGRLASEEILREATGMKRGLFFRFAADRR